MDIDRENGGDEAKMTPIVIQSKLSHSEKNLLSKCLIVVGIEM